MSKIVDDDALEEIEDEEVDDVEVKEIPKRKVIIKDKKLKIEDDEEEVEDLQSLKEQIKPKLKVIIKKKSILVKPSEDVEDEDAVIEKPKAKRTQKQIDAFEKVRQKKMENAKLREKERQKISTCRTEGFRRENY
jgi:hypothetical protein